MDRLQLDVNFFDPAFKEDPYPLYEEIRAVGNVVWNDLLPGWTVVGYDDALAVRTNVDECFERLNADPEYAPWFQAPCMITVDGPDHRRMRGGLSPLFTRGAVAKWEKRVAEVVESMLAPLVAGNDSFDLIGDFTMLPTVIVVDMLGVSPERYDDFRRWSHEIVTNLAWGFEDEQTRASLRQASAEVNDYLREEIHRHRREQPDDVLTFMEQFNVCREIKSHLAFGYGSHLCLGAPLARLEMKVAIEQLLRVAPEYRLRDVDFGNSYSIRGPERGTVDVGGVRTST